MGGGWGLWFLYTRFSERRKERKRLEQLEFEKQNRPYPGIIYTDSELENFRNKSQLLDSTDNELRTRLSEQLPHDAEQLEKDQSTQKEGSE